MKSIRLACLLAFTLVPFAAEAQSFNCRLARTSDEVLICQNSGLSALDERMARMYNRLRNQLSGGARRGLIQDQSAWLQSRYGCGRDAACIEDSYRQRIRELGNY
jgi:uncharacterized protein